MVICYSYNRNLIPILVPGSGILWYQIPKNVAVTGELGKKERLGKFEEHDEKTDQIVFKR